MATVGFKNSNGTDLGDNLVPIEYLIDRYPELADTFRFAGLWLWGRNNYGQLGDNTATNRSSPIQTISSGANWKFIASGGLHTAGIKTDGTLWLWGANPVASGFGGPLGDNTGTNRSSPVQTVSGGTNWKQVDCGEYSTIAIKTDGTLWTWGYNGYGQLGDNTVANNKSSPVQTISGGTNWKQCSLGRYFAAAIKTDGTLWLWGSNAYGQLGTNDITNYSSPVQTVSGGSNWKLVSAGRHHAAAIKTDGTLWTWGFNQSGQLGDNSTADKSSPVQTISGGTNWKQIVCAYTHTAAIKNDGTLWTWGAADYGALGDNTITSKSSPVQTVSGGTNWKQVSGGWNNTSAIKTDGTLWLWGRNDYGALGDNSTTRSSSPVQTVSGGTNWIQVVNEAYDTIAIRDNSNDYI